MTDENLLTIVVPTYNRLAMLRTSVQSILSQSCQSYRLLVADNCSSDGSWEYLQGVQRGAGTKVRIMRNETNLGSMGSATRWARLIGTPWATIVCDDDWVGPDFVRAIIPHIRMRNSGLVVVGHARTNQEGDVREVWNLQKGVIGPDRAPGAFFRRKVKVAGIGGFALPSRILKEGYFPRMYPGGFLEDTMICVRAMAEGGIISSEGIHYFRREWDGSEAKRQDRVSNWMMAQAGFLRDVDVVLRAAKATRRVRRLWTRPRYAGRLRTLAREVWCGHLTTPEARRYIRFAAKHSRSELVMALAALGMVWLRESFECDST
jgi:glycosyltransferase involved in cell wall biosynthesis